MRSLSDPFINRPVMTVVLTLSIIAFGIFSYRTLPLANLPNVQYPVIQVTAEFPGMAPDVIADNITSPLEQQFTQIPGLELITSNSTQGNSSILLQFGLGEDMDAASAQVQSALTRAEPDLPENIPTPPSYKETNPNQVFFYILGLASDTMPESQLYDYASTQVAQRVNMLEGVSDVTLFGGQRAVRIEVDPARLYNFNLTVSDVADAVESGSVLMSTGQLYGENNTIILRPTGQLFTAEDYGNLIVSYVDDAPIYIKDVADVEESVDQLYFINVFNIPGRSSSEPFVGISVQHTATSNLVDVAKRIDDLIDELRVELPQSIEVLKVYDESYLVVDSVIDVRTTLLIAFVLVVAVIFIFLGRAKDTVIPLVALPTSLLITFMVMKLLGFSLDHLSLLALTLAIGFLVDDAIVFLENMVRHQEMGKSAYRATLDGAKEISFTILSMTLSLTAVFIPLLFMSGQIGRIFREFSLTLMVAILASGLVSLTLTPMLCARLFSGKVKEQSWLQRISKKIETPTLNFYGKTLSWFLKFKFLGVIVWVVCLVGVGWGFVQVPKTFLPLGDSGLVFGVMLTEESTSPNRIESYQSAVNQILANDPAIETSLSATGLTSMFSPNMVVALAVLKPVKDRPSIQEVSDRLNEKIRTTIPGLVPLLSPQPALKISTGAISTNQGNYAYSVSGLDPEQIYESVPKLQEKLASMPGFVGVSSDLYLESRQLELDINRNLAYSLGVTAEEIEQLLMDAYSENYVYKIKEGVEQYQVIVEANATERSKPANLDNLYLTSSIDGSLIPLRTVASWKETVGPLSVSHINSLASGTIYFDLADGYPIGDATKALEEAAASIIPAGLIKELQGTAQAFTLIEESAGVLVLVAVFVMYVILAILYESYMHPLTVLSALPVATVGGLMTLLLFESEFSLYAFVGLFMLMGIVVKNGIMMVDFAIQRQAEGRTPLEAVHQGCIERFRPILMTTLAAIFGALPIALGVNDVGNTRVPLGLVIVGGLIVSQLLTLYVIPVIYLYFEAFQDKYLERIGFFSRKVKE